MARAEFKLDLMSLDALVRKFDSPALRSQLSQIASMKEVAALVAQAVADNFAQEGPGWQPLKGATIRNSVAMNKATKALMKDAYLYGARKIGATKTSKSSGREVINRKGLKYRKADFYKHVDEYIERVEAASRVNPDPDEALGNRQILRRTSLLYQTVTTPGYSGSAQTKSKKGGASKSVNGQNINRTEGTNLIWGTNLIYAATHEYGRGKIPQREFLSLRPQWEARLTLFVEKLMIDIIRKTVEGS